MLLWEMGIHWQPQCKFWYRLEIGSLYDSDQVDNPCWTEMIFNHIKKERKNLSFLTYEKENCNLVSIQFDRCPGHVQLLLLLRSGPLFELTTFMAMHLFFHSFILFFFKYNCMSVIFFLIVLHFIVSWALWLYSCWYILLLCLLFTFNAALKLLFEKLFSLLYCSDNL